MKRLFWVVIWGFFLYGELLPQTVPPVGELHIGLDFARFRNSSQSGYLEIYYSVLPSLLTFNQVKENFYGGVKIRTRIMNEETKEVLSENTAPVHIVETDTSRAWYSYPLTTQAGFALPFGKYIFEVVASDSIQPTRRDSISRSIEITGYTSSLEMSDLQLCKKIGNSVKKNDLFYKNSLEVVPMPSLVFGAVTCPVLFHYAELYNIEPGQEYFLRTQVINASDEIVRETKKKQAYKNTSSLIVGSTTVTSFPPGTYTFRCEVLDGAENVLANSDKGFVIINPHLNAATTVSASRIAQEIKGLSLEEITKEFRHAKYVATEDEIKIFEQVSSDAGMRKFLTDFWVRVSKGRMDRLPITRNTYLQRVEIANDQFGAFGKDGWRSDRGRVFILYGNPDEIERYPAQPDAKAYQIWIYYGIEDGVEFVFVDRQGYSDYQLVHSTKRGELFDEGWAVKYLQ